MDQAWPNMTALGSKSGWANAVEEEEAAAGGKIQVRRSSWFLACLGKCPTRVLDAGADTPKEFEMIRTNPMFNFNIE